MQPIYIGIDPAFRKDGFCICIIDECNTIDFKSFKSFDKFANWLYQDAPENAVFCIENSNLQPNTVFKYKDKDGKDLKGNSIALSVGKNMATSQITVYFCKAKYPKTTFDVSPKDKGAKWSDAIFKAVCKENKHAVPTSYKGLGSEQDERDAYALALIAKRLYQSKPFTPKK